MKRLRLPAMLALVAGIGAALAGTAWAADEPPVAPAKPYKDRVIAPDNLQPLPPDDAEAIDTRGRLRSYHAQLDVSRTQRGSESFGEQGISAGGFWETDTLGSFSADATVFQTSRDRFGNDRNWGGAATLWQRDLYVNGGWRLNNGLGVLNTPALSLERNQYRFFLPTMLFAGISSEWLNASRGLQLQAALGRAGSYAGTRVVGFDIAKGDVASLGAQWTIDPRWTVGASFLGTQGRIVPDDRGEAVFENGDTQAVHAAAAWKGAQDALQLNLLSSSGDRGPASGLWIDASAVRGRYVHNYGAFRLDPGLAWGALPINNDAQGAYYRIAYQYARWNWNAGIDDIRSISGNGFDGVYATGYARYQYNGTLGYGGGMSARRATDNAYSAQLFTDKRTDWGQTRVQVDTAHTGSPANDSWQVSVDQALPLQQGSRLDVSLAYGASDDFAGRRSRTTAVAVYGGRDLSNRLSLNGAARWTQGQGAAALRGLDLNLAVNWRLGSRWALIGTLYQSQGSQRSPYFLDPLATQTPMVSLPRDRSVFLSLRYDFRAGSPQSVIGGAPGGATGAVGGSVFLDDNGDGVRAASEQPASNVTVLLDGRYATRTDSAGNFAFPRVAVGAHTVTVVPDNLPLPWFIDDASGERRITVTVRDEVQVDIGARRPR